LAERADWTLFRTIEGLSQKAGVAKHRLRRLVLKELADNALDAGGTIRFGLHLDHYDVEDEDGDQVRYYFIEDDGPGLDGTPQEIANLFSIVRPLRSSKLLRLPQRGQLGNGLRVVAGAVLASDGTLTVVTRNRRISLRPESDGTTTVVDVVEADRPVGTRIEIGFGPSLPNDSDPFKWVSRADALAGVGQEYSGRSSAYWYDAAQYHELFLAYGNEPVRSVVAQLDGCTGGRRARSSPPPDSIANVVRTSIARKRPRCCWKRATWHVRSVRIGSGLSAATPSMVITMRRSRTL
jgi:hypothetical protein